jgi:predicted ribosomally synthesized peptide with SipW-like signal peptide
MESKTKKKLGTAVGSVAVVGAAIALTAGTFSYFSDTHAGPAQRVHTGSLKVGGSLSQPFDAKNIAPGYDQSRDFTVTNDGSLPGDLSLSVKYSGNAALEDALQLCYPGQKCQSVTDLVNSTKNNPIDVGRVDKQGSKTFTVELKFPDTGQPQNKLQNRTGHIKVVEHLRQINH